MPIQWSSVSSCARKAQTYRQLGTNIGANMIPKNLPNRAKMGSIAAKMEPKWRQDGVRTAKKQKKIIVTQQNHQVWISGAVFWTKKLPTWRQVGVPKRTQIDKIDANIDQKIDASWDRIYNDFNGFWEGIWKQVATNIDEKSIWFVKSRFLKIEMFFLRPKEKHLFWRFGGSKWGIKSMKNPSNNEVNMGGHLGVDFPWFR